MRMDEPARRLSRRNFLDLLLGASLFGWVGSVLYPVFEYFKVPPRREDLPASIVAAKIQDLKPNQGVIFKFGSSPGLLIMSPDGKLRAFSATCTHLDCTVRYRPDLQKIHCACHNGMYDLNGQNISGPPPRPLSEFRVVQQGDDVVIFRS